MLFLIHVILGWLILAPAAWTASGKATQMGVVEGHIHIISLKPVEPADGNVPTVTAQTYAEYPLVILSPDGKQEVARLTADGKGHYRLALPSGEYILDVQDRLRKHVRAKPQRFTVVSNQTVQVDIDMDTGIR